MSTANEPPFRVGDRVRLPDTVYTPDWGELVGTVDEVREPGHRLGHPKRWLIVVRPDPRGDVRFCDLVLPPGRLFPAGLDPLYAPGGGGGGPS